MKFPHEELHEPSTPPFITMSPSALNTSQNNGSRILNPLLKEEPPHAYGKYVPGEKHAVNEELDPALNVKLVLPT